MFQKFSWENWSIPPFLQLYFFINPSRKESFFQTSVSFETKSLQSAHFQYGFFLLCHTPSAKIFLYQTASDPVRVPTPIIEPADGMSSWKLLSKQCNAVTRTSLCSTCPDKWFFVWRRSYVQIRIGPVSNLFYRSLFSPFSCEKKIF